MSLIYQLLLFLFFFCISSFRGKEWNNEYLSKKQTIHWRALFALWVLLSHCGSQTIPVLDRIYRSLPLGSFLAVAGFFFFSGYGVQYNYINYGEQYMRAFPKKRFDAIILPYLILAGIYWLYNYIVDHTYSIHSVLGFFAAGDPMVLHSWYLIVVMLFYFCYYYEMLLLKEKYHLIVAVNLVLNVLWILVVKTLGWGYWWYSCTVALTLGIAWATYEDWLYKFIRSNYKLVSFVVILCGCLFAVLYKTYEKMLFEQFLNIFFILTVILYSMKFEIYSKLTAFIGGISFELYVIHGLVISSIPQTGLMTRDNYLFVPVVILISTALAFGLHKVFEIIKKQIV